jgi:hypothetical protein
VLNNISYSSYRFPPDIIQHAGQSGEEVRDKPVKR